MKRSFDGYGETVIPCRTLGAALLVLAISIGQPALASGPFQYVTPFFDERNREDLLAGHLTDRFYSMTLTSLISYLHLTGQFTPRHAALFRYERKELRTRQGANSPWRHQSNFNRLLDDEGYPRGRFGSWKTITRTETRDGQQLVTRYHIQNCLPDAFRVAGRTFRDRRSRHGSGSPELKRWVDAQIKVFDHCGGDRFDPPVDPQAGWRRLEKHDRQYQIAASYFYDGQYLEARRRFREIGAIPTSPWSALSLYLAGRSLVRHAKVDERNREIHLSTALAEYRLLAQYRAFLTAYPWILKQIRYVETLLNPIGILNELERKISRSPELASIEDIRDYVYLCSYHGSDRKGAGNYADWLLLSKALARPWSGDADERRQVIIARWREDNSLEWLFLALIAADSKAGEKTLIGLLDAARKFGPETPGYYVMLEHRVRITALMGDVRAALRLAQAPYLPGSNPLSPGHVNRVRLRAAQVSTNWNDYFRFASMHPLQLPWSDLYVGSLSKSRFNHITSKTTLFPRETTKLINNYFTPEMMLGAITFRSLGDYQRGRLAIAGWTKAMLLDDPEAARKLSRQVKRYVPRLRAAFERFETGRNPQLEAALIVLNNPAFSPRMWWGAGRVQQWDSPVKPTPDDVALPWNYYNWWCPRNASAGEIDSVLSGSRFAHYDEAQLEDIRQLRGIDQNSVAGFFGPPVLRYARSNLDDSRVPRALHRVVFASRYACMGGPRDISREAHNLLHKHFPDSEWAEKTPYWYE